MKRPKKLAHDLRMQWLAMLAGAPALIALLVLLFSGDYTDRLRWTLAIVCTLFWLAIGLSIRARVAHPLQTLSALLSALREGDFSVRGRGDLNGDPYAEVLYEVNALAEILQTHRLSALEATALLRTIMEEIDVAIFAFDEEGVLQLINPAGQHLLGAPAERLLGRPAAEIGLAELLVGEDTQLLESAFFPHADARTRWSLVRTSFRERGRAHSLAVVSDVGDVLRDEERKAWQRLTRVLGHELNNSLAPIKSIAGSLETLLDKKDRPADWEEDVRSGLNVIASRAEGLNRFMQAYSKLTRLPPPVLANVGIGQMIRHCAALETRLPVNVIEGADVMLSVDVAQIEQVLINLMKNAVEAALETGGGVSVSWALHGRQAEVVIEDGGPGIQGTTNLFVPFFTTKEHGSGIGLVLARQIVENHGGSLTLENRADGQSGCVAKLHLPMFVDDGGNGSAEQA